MSSIITSIILQIWYLLSEMSPYLIFGLLIAGVIHIIIPTQKIYAHFSKDNLWAVLKAALFGIPLPLCSCGVIPVAAHLRKQLSAKGPTIAFLISTPATGIDSIMATYSLLGPLFAIIRPIAALISGVSAGIIVNLLETKTPILSSNSALSEQRHSPPHHRTLYIIKEVIRYAFFDLIRDIGKWIIIGVSIGGLITYLVPTDLIRQYLGNPLIAYPLIIAIGLPMYVCATGSIPIAASLIMKGMNPGAGLVFLIIGPATNIATLSFVAGKLGKKTLIIYILTLIITALCLGLSIDLLWGAIGKDFNLFRPGITPLPLWLKTLSAILFTGCIVNARFKRQRHT